MNRPVIKLPNQFLPFSVDNLVGVREVDILARFKESWQAGLAGVVTFADNGNELGLLNCFIDLARDDL